MNELQRRDFLGAIGAATVTTACAPPWLFSGQASVTNKSTDMYGLIGKITAKPGQRDALIETLVEGAEDLPGCLTYVVAKDSSDENTIWVTEVWESQARHEESLSLPTVQEAMAKGKPMIAEFGEQIETQPIGGYGLEPADSQ